MWEFIDKVCYINLDHRQDRRDGMINFFKEGGVPDEKVQRISAVRIPHNGMIGCAKSHIATLELAKLNKWKAVLITEDDLEWLDFDHSYKKLEDLISTQQWDVCMLTGLFMKAAPPKVIAAYYSNAYIVKEHYYDTLIQNMKEGLQLKEETLRKEKHSWLKSTLHPLYKHIYNIDVYWIKLQLRDRWIGSMPPICRQIQSYSDINTSIIQPPVGVYQGDDYRKFDLGIVDYFLENYSYSNQ